MSKQESNEAVRERYHPLDSTFLYEALWLAFLGTVIVVSAFALGEGWKAQAGIVGGMLLVGTAIGVWRAQEWARVTAGVLTLASGLAGSVMLFAGDEPIRFGRVVHVLMQLGSGVYFLLPSTRAAFHQARTNRAAAAARRR